MHGTFNPAEDNDAAAKRLAIRLAIAAALGGGNAAVIFATSAILGAAMAPNAGYATAPVSLFVIGMACSALAIGWIARRYGRRASFLTGAACGALCGFLAASAAYFWAFPLLCCATFSGGVYAAAAQSYRFAAADGASPRFQPKAISWVMAGGVAAGIIGPQLVQWTMDIWPQHLFAVTYLGQAALALLAMLALSGVKPQAPLPPPVAPVRPLREIVRQPAFIVAALCGTVSYALMNLLMTSAPLAMKLCGLSLSQSTSGIQWHVLAMYIPSFFTGSLILRFGASRIIVVGLLLEIAAALVDLSGVTVWHFWGGLVLLGLGWNFGFIGASALVLKTHQPHERTKVQSFNDFIIFGVMAVGSFLSGQLLASGGWSVINFVVFPFAFLALLGLGSGPID